MFSFSFLLHPIRYTCGITHVQGETHRRRETIIKRRVTIDKRERGKKGSESWLFIRVTVYRVTVCGHEHQTGQVDGEATTLSLLSVNRVKLA